MSFVVEGLVHFSPDVEHQVKRFLEEFESIELPVLEASRLGLAGAWTLEGGSGTDVLHLYGPVAGLADLTSSARSIAQLPDGHAYLRLYEWMAGTEVTYARTVRPLIDPVDQAWWERRTSAPAEGIHVVASCRYGLMGESAVRPSVTEAVCELDDETTDVLLAYDTLFGDFGSTRVIGATASEPDFVAGLEALSGASASQRGPWTSVVATPTSYSPLQ